MAAFITQNFLPVKADIKEHPTWFHRFEVLWTPTVLILDPGGKERVRLEGYLPKVEFRAQLELGLARVAFMSKQWAEAERRYSAVAQNYPETAAAPEAVYWSCVSRYKGTHDHTALGEAATRLAQAYPASIWAKKASVWGVVAHA